MELMLVLLKVTKYVYHIKSFAHAVDEDTYLCQESTSLISSCQWPCRMRRKPFLRSCLTSWTQMRSQMHMLCTRAPITLPFSGLITLD